jgi:hypothetical protein
MNCDKVSSWLSSKFDIFIEKWFPWNNPERKLIEIEEMEKLILSETRQGPKILQVISIILIFRQIDSNIKSRIIFQNSFCFMS